MICQRGRGCSYAGEAPCLDASPEFAPAHYDRAERRDVRCGLLLLPWGRSNQRSRLRSRGLCERGFYERLQLASLMQLANDIASADELAVNIYLRDRRPIAVALDPITQFGIAQNVGGLVGHAQLLEDRDLLSRESALRKTSVALPEDHDLLVFNRRLDLFDDVCHVKLYLRF